jgi:hypothetical protein
MPGLIFGEFVWRPAERVRKGSDAQIDAAAGSATMTAVVAVDLPRDQNRSLYVSVRIQQPFARHCRRS